MSIKNSAVIDLGYPIYGTRFVNNKTLLAVGGGGEGNNGIPNKITAVKCSFQIKDKNRKLQRFREIILPSDEDSPMCVDACRHVGVDDSISSDYNVLVGCNQSNRLLKTMNMNNNVRKYSYTSDEHLQFYDAVQFEESVSINDAGDYPKIITLSANGAVGGLMTSKIPSSIYIFNPDSLDVMLKYTPAEQGPVEIKDFCLSSDGKSLCYITAHSIEFISSVTHVSLSLSKTSALVTKALLTLFLSKLNYLDDSTVVIAASSKAGISLLKYSITQQQILSQKLIAKKVKSVVAMDVSQQQDLVAVAGNDFSVTLIRLSDFKVLKTFAKLHKFAITSLSFCPNGSKLASASAANSLHVLKIPKNYSKGKSTIGSLFNYLFIILVVAAVSIFVQKAHESGDLQQYYEQYYALGEHYFHIGHHYGKEYGSLAYEFAKDQSLLGYDFVKDKYESYRSGDSSQDYFKMESWDEAVGKSFAPTELEDIVVEVTLDADTSSSFTKTPEPVVTLSTSTETHLTETSETQTQETKTSETPEVQTPEVEEILEIPDIEEVKNIVYADNFTEPNAQDTENTPTTEANTAEVEPDTVDENATEEDFAREIESSTTEVADATEEPTPGHVHKAEEVEVEKEGENVDDEETETAEFVDAQSEQPEDVEDVKEPEPEVIEDVTEPEGTETFEDSQETVQPEPEVFEEPEQPEEVGQAEQVEEPVASPAEESKATEAADVADSEDVDADTVQEPEAEATDEPEPETKEETVEQTVADSEPVEPEFEPKHEQEPEQEQEPEPEQDVELGYEPDDESEIELGYEPDSESDLTEPEPPVKVVEDVVEDVPVEDVESEAETSDIESNISTETKTSTVISTSSPVIPSLSTKDKDEITSVEVHTKARTSLPSHDEL